MIQKVSPREKKNIYRKQLCLQLPVVCLRHGHMTHIVKFDIDVNSVRRFTDSVAYLHICLFEDHSIFGTSEITRISRVKSM